MEKKDKKDKTDRKKRIVVIFAVVVAVVIVALTTAYFMSKQDIKQVDVATFVRSARSGVIEKVIVYSEDAKTMRYIGLYGKNTIADGDGIETLVKDNSSLIGAIEKIALGQGIVLNYNKEPAGYWAGWWLVGGGITLIISTGIIIYALCAFLLVPFLADIMRYLRDSGLMPKGGNLPGTCGGQQGEGQHPGQAGQSSFAESKKKMKRVTFADVAGCDEAKEELVSIVEYLRKDGDKILYKIMDGKIPKGVLLHGPPGTGKTLLARAIAGEAGVPFISCSGSEFIEMYVGVGAKRVRELMAQARKKAPCIVFIDEIDSIGGKREGGSGGGKEHQQTINQLLYEMDGFSQDEGVIFLAATNRMDMLDPAILRPGRFDKNINVGLPELKDRVEILKIHTRNKPLAEDVVLKDIAKMCAGFSGADLEGLANEAAKLTIRGIKSHNEYGRIKKYLPQMLLAKMGIEEFIEMPVFGISHDAFVKAWDTVVSGGAERPNIMSDKEKRETAIHEAGHALIAYIRHIFEPDDTNPLYKVSIIPRGEALGLTYMLPGGDSHSMSKRKAYNKLLMLFGGWAAEKIVIGVTSSGVTSDIQKATGLVKNMVLRWGMSNNLPPMHLAGSGGGVYGESRSDKYSGATEEEINSEIRALITVGHQKAELMVGKNRVALDALVEALLEKEALNQKECEKILSEKIPPENLEKDAYSTKKEEQL